MSKFIKIPPTVKMINVNTKEATDITLSFRSFVCEDVSAHPMWGISLTETRAFKDILDALDEAEEGGSMKLSESVYPFLRTAAEKPEYRTVSNGQEVAMRGYRRWNGTGMVQLLPFIEAIMNATDTALAVDLKTNGKAPVKELKTPLENEATA